MAEHHAPNGQFLKGWPGGPGRPRKAPPPDDSAQAIYARRGFVPHELLVDACQQVQQLLADGQLTKQERIKLIGIYVDTILRTAEFVTPKLKAVEHSGQVDLLQRLQAVSQCTDEELVRLIADTEAYLEQQS